MHGANIQDLRCPRCRIRRTLRYRSASFCFNCHLFWDGVPASDSERWPEPAYPFTPAEVARLSVYRASIQAGFYTDR